MLGHTRNTYECDKALEKANIAQPASQSSVRWLKVAESWRLAVVSEVHYTSALRLVLLVSK